jgi:hypothetical protein
MNFPSFEMSSQPDFSLLVALADAAEEESLQALDPFREVSSDDEDPRCFIQELLQRPTRERDFVSLVGFGVEDFHYLFNLCSTDLLAPVRGRRRILSPIQSFFLTLHHLRCTRTIPELITHYHLEVTGPSLSKTMARVLDVMHATFPALFIVPLNWNQQREAGINIPTELPCATVLVDVTFQPTNRPYGTFSEAKVWYSGKHKAYGIKTEIAHATDGRAIGIYSGVKGSVHDLTILRGNSTFYLELLRGSSPPDGPALLVADKAYIGVESVEGITAAIPTRKRKGQSLTSSERERNRRISSVRIRAEMFYGRLKNKFAIMRRKYTLDRDEYSKRADVCVALTNYDLLSRPLARRDSEYNLRLRITEQRVVDEGAETRRRSQNQRQNERRLRLRPSPENR